MNSSQFLRNGCAFALLFVVLGFSSKRSHSYEYQLVQTYPVETDLRAPHLPEAGDVWKQMVRTANRTIDIAQFYTVTKQGTVIEEVMEELKFAAEDRGVQIRLLVSNVFSETYKTTIDRIRKLPGAKVRIYNLKKLTGGIIHSKHWIIDGKRAFVGSQNFDWRALMHIQELGVLTDDPAVVEPLQEIFRWDWVFAGTGKFPKDSRVKKYDSMAELVASPRALMPKGIRFSLDVLAELANSANKSLEIQLLNYKPYETVGTGKGSRKRYWGVIDQLLKKAAKRGVQVRLLVSDWNTNEPGLSYLIKLDRTHGIDVRIAKIPQHSSGVIPYARVIHSKLMLVDRKALWLGTSNWSKGYFSNTRGIEVVFKQERMAKDVGRVFERVWNHRKYTVPVRKWRGQAPQY